MIDYSTLWKKSNEIFYSWEVEEGKPFSDEDRILFVTGFIKGYLFVNDIEVCYENC